MRTPEAKNSQPVTIAQIKRFFACLFLYTAYLIVTIVLCSEAAGGLFRLLCGGIAVILFVLIVSVLSITAFGLLAVGICAMLRAIGMHETAAAISRIPQASDGLLFLILSLTMLLLPLYALVHYL
ncbi:MAG: hypothetical protein J6K32_03675 [Clostridia bacterium]|nr:hypothetical protein [Clostridia bacterium]